MNARAPKLIATAILALSWAALAAGCVTIGYDFVRQQATLTYTHTPTTKGYAK